VRRQIIMPISRLMKDASRLLQAGTFAIACTCILVMSGSNAWAQAAPRIIVGQVVDSATGRPLPNALVQLDSTYDAGMSDSTGTFRFTSGYTARSRTLRIRRVGYRQGTFVLPQVTVADSMVTGRITLVAQSGLWLDRMPDCREFKGAAPPLRKDSILEWIQERRSSTGGVTSWLCRVKIGPDTPAP
jgi:hypothetical protein